MILHGTDISGHTQRVACLLSMLGLPYELRPGGPDVRATPAFGELNPWRQIPVLQDGELLLVDSHAILVYLARRYDPTDRWLPTDPVGMANVQRWLSVSAGELANGPAKARAALMFGRDVDLPRAQAMARTLFERMDAHLADRAWLAADHPTIADLALDGYTRAAPEGDVTLEPYPHVRAWLDRVAALPGYVRLPPVR
ncbi:MAG: glutathione S-transferase [Myxococcales bacterium]|nr:glutathione S-transferase [Myxococcales bacterium]